MNIDISLIRESFQAIKPYADDFSEHFYQELFTRYPQAQALFAKTKMAKQRKALVAALSHIVDFWEEQEHLQDYLSKMGGRHVKYSTEQAHFPLVGEALLATLEYFFEDQWTEALKAQWSALYEFIQLHMTKGMIIAQKQLKEMGREVPPPSIEEMARTLAREAFKKAFDEEANTAVLEMARDKAREILKKALETEARDAMRLVTRKTA